MKKVPRRRLLGRIFCKVSLWVVIPLVLSACSTTEERPAPLQLAPVIPYAPGESAATRSPSAMEALSRGLAAVTPPAAPLKDVYYSFDSTSIAAEAEETLKQNAEWMKANPKMRVEVEGHCDDLGSAEYNLALGAKRAQAAKDFLVSQGVDAERLVTISYGKEAPACFEPTEECRIRNRRARFVIFAELPTS